MGNKGDLAVNVSKKLLLHIVMEYISTQSFKAFKGIALPKIEQSWCILS